MDKDACNPWYSTVTSTPLSLSFSHNNPRSCEGYLKKRRRNAIYVFASYFGEYQQQLYMFFFHWKKKTDSPLPGQVGHAQAQHPSTTRTLPRCFVFVACGCVGTHPYCINLPVPAPAAAMRWTYRDSVRGLQVGRSKEFWLPCHAKKKRAYMQGPRTRDTAGSTQVMERRLPANTLSDQSGRVK